MCLFTGEWICNPAVGQHAVLKAVFLYKFAAGSSREAYFPLELLPSTAAAKHRADAKELLAALARKQNQVKFLARKYSKAVSDI